MITHKIRNNKGDEYELFSFQTDVNGKNIRMIGLDKNGRQKELKNPEEWEIFATRIEERDK